MLQLWAAGTHLHKLLGEGPILWWRKQAMWRGVFEGRAVSDIVMDTERSRTMVHCDPVGEDKQLEGKVVSARCAHRDTVLYPLAEVDMELDGVPRRAKAAIADWLPVSVLRETDVPELGRLL